MSKSRPYNAAGIQILRLLWVVRRKNAPAHWKTLVRLKQSLMRFIFQSALVTILGWVAANGWADGPYRGSYRLLFTHSDWALQTKDLAVNSLVLALICIGQILILGMRICRKAYQLSLGFLIGILAFFGLGILLIQRLDSFRISYDLHLDSPLTFCLAWICISIILFPGLDRSHKSHTNKS